MKPLIRLFFRTLRRIIGPIMLFIDWVTTPKGIQRPIQEQEKIDLNTQNMALYQFKTCPFCIKVRRHTQRLSLNIETRDALRDPTSRTQLLTGGGEIKVPCLRSPMRPAKIAGCTNQTRLSIILIRSLVSTPLRQNSMPPDIEQPTFDPQQLLKLASYRMPFGKYANRLLIDLPEPYVVWFSGQGFPKGELGRMLGIVHEIKLNGLEYLFEPLRSK